MPSSARSVAASLASVALLAVACGSGQAAGSFADVNPIAPPRAPDGGSDTGADDLAGCARQEVRATPLPLDLLLVLDTSGSMNTQVAAGRSKLDAVRDAIRAFAADPAAAGTGVGLTFFPNRLAGVPATCTAQADCGASGPCTFKACDEATAAWCDSSAICSPGIACVAIGKCAADAASFCLPIGSSCGLDAVGGFDRGTCIEQTSGACARGDSCQDADYSTPAVPITPLPAAIPALESALAGRTATGETPTSAALNGAFDAARDQAKRFPGHSVVVLLATDGAPTECTVDSTQLAAIVATARTGAPGIKTFVIGVFADDEAAMAQPHLDAIAAAGGGGKALIVPKGATTTPSFLAALDGVRAAALPCEIDLPRPDGGLPDFGALNVRYTDASGAKEVYRRRASAASCDASGGWFYDVDPAAGVPTKVILCPASCNELKATSGVLNVVLGCQTLVR